MGRNQEFSEDTIERIISILPEVSRVRIYPPVPEALSSRFIRQWTGRTQDNVPFDVSHKLIYEIKELPKEEVPHVYREAVLNVAQESGNSFITLYLKDCVQVDLYRSAINVHARRQPAYIDKVLAILGDGELSSNVEIQGQRARFELSYQVRQK